MNMSAVDINPFADHSPAPFFKGGRRQELLQYIRHLSINLYDLVLVSGPKGVGKTTLLGALCRQLDDDLIPPIQIDVADYQGVEGAARLCNMLETELDYARLESGDRRSAVGSIQNAVRVGAPAQLVCMDNAQLWSEAEFNTFLSLLMHYNSTASADKHGSDKRNKIRLKCIACIDSDGWAQAQRWSSFRNLDQLSYLVELQPFGRSDIQKYLDYRLNLVGMSRVKFSKRDVDRIVKRSKGMPADIDRYAESVLARQVHQKPAWFLLLPLQHILAVMVLLVGLIALWRYDNSAVGPVGVVEPSLSGVSDLSNVDRPAGMGIQPLQERALDASEEPVLVEGGRVAQQAAERQVTSVAVAERGAVTQTVREEPIDAQLTAVTEVEATSVEVEEADSVTASTVVAAKALQLKRDQYTIQMLAGQNLSDILKRVEVLQARYGLNAGYFKRTYRGRDWYIVAAGAYDTQAQAASALAKLPSDLRASKPWIRHASKLVD